MFKIYRATDHGTDGRDTRTIGYFATEELAKEAAKGRGAMGFGDGSIDVIDVFETGDQEQSEIDAALNKLTARERQLLGLAG